jgi:DNA ligase 1
MTLDAVLLYAQVGHGQHANLHTDCTFAVWNRRPADAAEALAVIDTLTRRERAEPGGLMLVTLAKASSGLSDAEFARVDREVRAHTLEKFGPVRSLRPTLLIELAFEGIGASARHKSGLALRGPRMLRIRDDKPLHEADDLDTLRRWLLGA